MDESGRGNVELVRDAFAAFERGGVDAVLPLIAEDVRIYSLPDWPDDAEYHGHEGFRKLTVAWTEHFDGFGFEVEDLRDAGDKVAVLLRMMGRAKVSGMPLTQEIGAVFSRFGDGRVGEVRYHPSWEEALAAASVAANEER